jgi:two-component system, sporulation sensor kinase E
MADQSVGSDSLRNLLSLSQTLLDRCRDNRPVDRYVEDLAEELALKMGIDLAGFWIHQEGEWTPVDERGGSLGPIPESVIDQGIVTDRDDVQWWPIPDSSSDQLAAVLAVGTSAPSNELEFVYDELLPTLKIYVQSIRDELSVARHELLDPPEVASPDVEDARRSGSLDEILQSLVESVGQLFECDNCRLFWLVDEDRIRLRAESSPTGEIGSTVSVDQDPIIQSVIREEKTIIINNLPEHEGRRRRSDEVRSFLSVPFRHGDRVLGALNLSSEDEDVYTRDTLEQLSAVADNFALVHEISRQLTNLTGYVEEILSNLPVGVISVEPDRDRVRLNPEALSILSLDDERITYREFSEHVREELGAGDLIEVIEATERGDDRRRREFQLETGGAHPRTVEAFGSSVEEVEDETDRFIVVLNDVTEQRLLSEQVNRTERLAALGELAAGLAHEIKNPLTSIQGFVQLLPERGDDPEFLEKTSDVIGRESRRLNALVDNLVSFAKPQVGSRSSFRLNRVLDDVEMLVQKQLEKNDIDYSIDVPDSMTVFGDEQKLKQVIMNLTLNAVDAMSEGGTLTLSARTDDNEFTRITVEDTGEGMQEDQLEQVFNPFYTTKEEGTGLGLAISHRIVEEHGGTIDFDSEPGSGTRVDVSMPPEKLQKELDPGELPSDHVSPINEDDN